MIVFLSRPQDHILGPQGSLDHLGGLQPSSQVHLHSPCCCSWRVFLLSCSKVPASVTSTLTWRHLEVLEVICLFSVAKRPWMPARLSWESLVSQGFLTTRLRKALKGQPEVGKQPCTAGGLLPQPTVWFFFFTVVVELLGYTS